MSDLINRADATDAIEKLMKIHFDRVVVLNKAKDAINALPSADRPTGHIVTKSSGKFNPTVWAECSECEKPIDPWDKFCRHCGAKMGDEDND